MEAQPSAGSSSSFFRRAAPLLLCRPILLATRSYAATRGSSDADREREAAVGWVEVEEHEVRAVRLVDARVPSIHVDAVHLHHPEDRLRRVDEREVDEPRLA